MNGKAGRPTRFNSAVSNAICERISDGESLRSICSSDKMPAKSTVLAWLADHDDFRTKYALAREAQADALFDDMLDIADDGSNDWMEKHDAEGGNVGWRENGEAIRRSDLRIKTRQWMAAKLQPKKYGEKLDLNVSGSLQTVPEEQLDERIAHLLGKAGVGGASGGAGPQDEDKQA